MKEKHTALMVVCLFSKTNR